MNPIDKKIREKFQNHQPTVDTDALWKEVYPSIRKKKKPYMGFMLIATLCILGSSFLWYNYTMQSKHTTESIKEQAHIYIDALNQEKKTQEQKTIQSEVKTELINNKYDNTNTLNTLTKQNQELNKASNKLKKATKVISSERSTQNPKENRIPNEIFSKRNHSIDVENISYKEAVPNTTLNRNIASDKTKTTFVDNTLKSQIRKGEQFSILESLKIKSLQIEEKSFDGLGKSNTEKNKNTWFINPSIGLYYTGRNLLAENRNLDALIAERNQKESQLETVISEIALGRAINNKWGISFGANYRVASELAENTVQSQDTVLKDNIVIEVRNMPDGSKQEIIGSAQVPQTIISEEGKYAKFQSVSVFADAYYRFNTKRFIWQAELGIQQSMLLSASGHIVHKNINYWGSSWVSKLHYK